MPAVSRFYGITIYLYHRDHAPPHFHARYAGQDAQFLIADGSLMAGQPPARVISLVREWAQLHRAELSEGWDLAQQNRLPPAIQPLP